MIRCEVKAEGIETEIRGEEMQIVVEFTSIYTRLKNSMDPDLLSYMTSEQGVKDFKESLKDCTKEIQIKGRNEYGLS